MDKLDSQSGKAVANAFQSFVYGEIKARESIAPFDKSLEGIVTAIQTIPKRYTVKIKNTDYLNVRALVMPRAIAIGDKVLCTIENNQMINLTIVGIFDE